MATVSEERDDMRKLLRQVCRSGVALPRAVSDWWVAEQAEIQQERNREDARKASRAAEIAAKIASLQEELASIK